MPERLSCRYEPYRGPLRRGGLTAWWPIARTELKQRVFRWRYLLLYLFALTPFLFREALLYAFFVVAPARVNVKAGLSGGFLGRLLQYDKLPFYSDYLEDRFLWIFLLFTAAILGVPSIARDLRTRAWEIYFSRAIGPVEYSLGKFAAVFFVLFALTGGGVTGLYLTTSLLGPDPEFFLANLGWLPGLLGQAALLSAVLALTALAVGTLSENGIVLAGGWLGLFFVAFCIARVLRLVHPDGGFDWIDPKYLFMALSSLLHGHTFHSGFPAWISAPLLGLLVLGAVGVLAVFLTRQQEGIG